MMRRPIQINLTAGLPPAGYRGQYLGPDADGCQWLLCWEPDGLCWSALGFERKHPKPWPVLHKLIGDKAGMILGHVRLPDSDFAAGRPARAAAILTAGDAP